jgi:hypothetical protein
MCENSTGIPKWKLLTTWSILNIVGWLVGILFMFFNPSLEYDYKFSAPSTFIGWLPLGASIGLFQWFGLKRLRVNLVGWVLVTTLGFSTFFTLYGWVQNFDSYEYREYNIPVWLIVSGLATATLVGGAIIGFLQSPLIRKHISGLGSWVWGYILAPFLRFVVGFVIVSIKSALLKMLYFLGWYEIALGPGKFFLLYAVVVLVISITISLFTRKALLKESSLHVIPNTG